MAEKQTLAKLKYHNASFEVISEGTYVLCAVTGKKINVKRLKYWNVERQEAYIDSLAATSAYEQYENISK